jgi:hypothetical protein
MCTGVRGHTGAQENCDRKVVKEWFKMRDGWYLDANGNRVEQSLYFDNDDEDSGRPGQFKGMVQILSERGYDFLTLLLLKYECPKFQCPPPLEGLKPTCCCRRLMYTQPDCVNAESLVEEICRERGYNVIFLPKFHPELNPIEQCWGYAKEQYRKLPASSAEDVLERNVVKVLDEIPLDVIRRFLSQFS